MFYTNNKQSRIIIPRLESVPWHPIVPYNVTVKVTVHSNAIAPITDDKTIKSPLLFLFDFTLSSSLRITLLWLTGAFAPRWDNRDTIKQWGKVYLNAYEDYTFLEWDSGSDEVVGEVKVYQYEYDKPYVYTVNKWGRYTVVNAQTAEIVAQTYDLNELPEEHKKVFAKGLSENISYRDSYPKGQSIEFGDGTIYIEFDDGDMLIYSEKEYDHEHRNYPPMMKEAILFYKQEGNLLYAIREDLSYVVINTDTYEVLLDEKDIGKISKAYKAKFKDLSTFSGKQAAWYQVSGKNEYPDDTVYVVEDKDYDVLGLGKRVYLYWGIFKGYCLYEGEPHDNKGHSILKGKLCFYKVKDGLVYAIGDDLTYLVADVDTGEVIFKKTGINRMSDDYAQRLGEYASDFDNLDEMISGAELTEQISKQNT